MKKKVIVALCLVSCMSMAGLTGCGAITEAVEDKVTEALTEEEPEVEVAPEEVIEDDVEEVDVEDDAEEEKEETTESEKPAASSDLGDNYADLDNLLFSVNGKTYTVGQTTLQEMIDDGVPFDEDDIANAGNNLNGNSESQGFSIVLGEYYNAIVYAGNYTDDNKTTAECPISEIYLPVHSDEEQDILAFAFPLTLTEEELLANAGEPTELDEWESDDSDSYINTYDYTKESDVYYGDWGYSFEFMNGEFDYVTINWLP